MASQDSIDLVRVDLFNAWEYVGDGLARAALRLCELEAIESHLAAVREISPQALRSYKAEMRKLGHKLESNRAMAAAWTAARMGHHPYNRTAAGDPVKTAGNDFEYHLAYLLRKGGGWNEVHSFVREHLWQPAHTKLMRRLMRRAGVTDFRESPKPKPNN